MAKVEMTLEEYEALRRLILSERESEGSRLALRKKSTKRKAKKARKKTAWDRHLKSFKFRKQKRNESNSDYFGARTKAASRAYKRRKKK